MRHRLKKLKLGRDYKHTKSILRSLASQLIKHEKIVTTKAKAKVLRSFIEKIITRSKSDTIHNRRLIYKQIRDTKLIVKLFEDLGKRYISRNGGYTRTLLLQKRLGDNSEKVRIELLEELLESEGQVQATQDDPKIIDISENNNITEKKEKEDVNNDSQDKVINDVNSSDSKKIKNKLKAENNESPDKEKSNNSKK